VVPVYGKSPASPARRATVYTTPRPLGCQTASANPSSLIADPESRILESLILESSLLAVRLGFKDERFGEWGFDDWGVDDWGVDDWGFDDWGFTIRDSGSVISDE
jgi:hypothetical protein